MRDGLRWRDEGWGEGGGGPGSAPSFYIYVPSTSTSSSRVRYGSYLVGVNPQFPFDLLVKDEAEIQENSGFLHVRTGKVNKKSSPQHVWWRELDHLCRPTGVRGRDTYRTCSGSTDVHQRGLCYAYSSSKSRMIASASSRVAAKRTWSVRPSVVTNERRPGWGDCPPSTITKSPGSLSKTRAM